jgi:hypothetical protein
MDGLTRPGDELVQERLGGDAHGVAVEQRAGQLDELEPELEAPGGVALERAELQQRRDIAMHGALGRIHARGELRQRQPLGAGGGDEVKEIEGPLDAGRPVRIACCWRHAARAYSPAPP